MKEHHNSETEKLRMDTDNKRRCEIETDHIQKSYFKKTNKIISETQDVGIRENSVRRQ